ncbi:MAG TPA: purine-nucleoside phosphorylase, partial [Phycisphaerales bacterium]|nr:purine-nucleoside phosphorylase [Phycisphaerales bacterium]
MEDINERIQQATKYLKEKVAQKPDFALILGSGLGELAEKAENAQVVSYKDIPGFPVSTAPGHKGNL